MAVTQSSKTLCTSLCSMVAKFWWRSRGKDKGIHWKRWSTLTTSKGNGGMDFREYFSQNLAYLGKQAWRAYTNPQALWVQVLKAIYYPNQDILDTPKILQAILRAHGCGRAYYKGEISLRDKEDGQLAMAKESQFGLTDGFGMDKK